MNRHAVVVGGFMTGETCLEPVAEAVCGLGLADDAEIFTFPRVMLEEDRLSRAAERALVVTHSAGIRAVTSAMQPESLVAVSGPEPGNLGKLLLAASCKPLSFYRKSHGSAPEAAAYRRVFADNLLQSRTQLRTHLPHIIPTNRFSTIRRLAAARDAGIGAAAIRTRGDTFFPYDPGGETYGVPVYLADGCHDELLVAPAAVLGVLPERP